MICMSQSAEHWCSGETRYGISAALSCRIFDSFFEQCDGFLRILGNRLRGIPFSDASLCSVVMLPSKDAASNFAAFPLQVSSAFFRNVCLAVDATCAALSLPSQSLSPMPHLSFARIPTPLSGTPAIMLPRVSKISLRCLHVNIGKLKHILPLSDLWHVKNLHGMFWQTGQIVEINECRVTKLTDVFYCNSS